ncbi:MAG: nucleotidyl transferase AbiEii/AbiGii toxin family protein [Acidimicrobiales bacterium]
MNSRSDAQVIEVFHLLFLQALTANASNWFVLKGGANIRYFFQSDRYSNDIDLDFFTKPGWSVEETVDKVLDGRALAALLRHQDLKIVEVTKPKQTTSTRRWKAALSRNDTSENVVRTKIEFSGRNEPDSDRIFEVIPDAVLNNYGVSSISLSHYGHIVALEQKIAALALRNETKARDVFDIELLLRLHRVAGSPRLDTAHALNAAARAREVTYQSFRSEVLPFLDDDVAVLYENEKTWSSMRDSVSSALTEIGTVREEMPS